MPPFSAAKSKFKGTMVSLVCLCHRVLRRGLPLWRELLDRPRRVPAVIDIADHREADARLFSCASRHFFAGP